MVVKSSSEFREDDFSVILALKMPQIGAGMTEAVVEGVLMALGAEVRPNQPLLDIRVDFSGGAAQDCPPISFFRIVAREKGCVREITCKRGDRVLVGAGLALLTTSPDDAMGLPVARGLRTTAVGVLHSPDWLTPTTPT
jgi:hypothetical protein